MYYPLTDHHHHDHHDISKVARRPRQSPYPMVNFEEALAKVMENAPILQEETINCTGR